MSAALKRVERWLDGIPFEGVWCNGVCISVRDLREVVRLARIGQDLVDSRPPRPVSRKKRAGRRKAAR